MKILIQWALSTPQDYTEYNLTSKNLTRTMPNKSEPTGTPTINNTPGWITSMNIQGIVFEGYDHYGFQWDTQQRKATITCWADDPEDIPDGLYYGVSWELWEPRGDPKIGGRVNTVQKPTFYFYPNDPMYSHLQAQGADVRPYIELPKPASKDVRHGVWLSDTLFEQHRAVRGFHSWEEWIV